MDQGLVAQAGEGALGRALVGEGDRGRQWLVGHSLPAPLGHGPCGPLGAPKVPGLTDRVSHQPHAPAQLGGRAVRRSPEVPGGVRRETLQGCLPISCLPSRPLLFLPHHPRREMKALASRVGRCSLPGWCHRPPPPRQPRLEGAVGQDGRTDRFLLHHRPLLPGDQEKAQGEGDGWWRPVVVVVVLVAAAAVGFKAEPAPKLLPLARQPSQNAPNDPLPWDDS